MATLQKIGERISQSKWTKLYIALALLQGVMIIALQSAIASQNTAQASNIALITSPSYSHSINDHTMDANDGIQAALSRLNRIKWENIAFIGFQVWFVGMAFDATIYQNAAEIIVLAILNGICAILGGLQVMDGQRWLDRLDRLNTDYDLTIDLTPLQTAFYIEIVLTVVIILYALVFAYVSYLVVKEFGWVIYKKIGPDVVVQRMYRIFQFFVLTLKIDIFIEFLVSCFYLVQFAVDDGFHWDGYIQLVVTILILPALYYGRMTAGGEHHGRMLLFIIFQFVVVFSLILMLWRTMFPQNEWYTWIAFVIMGIVFALATAILGAWTMSNFGKGLEPYVRRGGQKKEQMSRHELREQRSVSSWRIDDD
ncbi:hypothetical protein K492DRAFT_175272 [Lichtheimia hyalospora FSU 10163]|nr:hypothetical protein K492DRAFT_175272 [Lichtheimia hyalospora FSU 10163]